ncbi:MAG: hypothetical protein V8R91_16375 [Butyricimonas faecihominis]
MVKRFCQWLYEEWSENFIFVCQEEMVKGTYVRFEYKLRFMREVMVQYLQHRLLKWFDENQRIFPWREDRRRSTSKLFLRSCYSARKRRRWQSITILFSLNFPIGTLANASLEELEEIMKPLGLYRHRARRLYKLGEDIADGVEDPGKRERVEGFRFYRVVRDQCVRIVYLEES